MRKTLILIISMLCLAATSGCVYRAAISQGNLIEQEDVDQLEIGMTTNQVRFLLGTPMINDAFSRDRWDYVYYLKIRRDDAINKRWVSIYFEEGVVSEIRADLELSPDL